MFNKRDLVRGPAQHSQRLDSLSFYLIFLSKWYLYHKKIIVVIHVHCLDWSEFLVLTSVIF